MMDCPAYEALRRSQHQFREEYQLASNRQIVIFDSAVHFVWRGYLVFCISWEKDLEVFFLDKKLPVRDLDAVPAIIAGCVTALGLETIYDLELIGWMQYTVEKARESRSVR